MRFILIMGLIVLSLGATSAYIKKDINNPYWQNIKKSFNIK